MRFEKLKSQEAFSERGPPSQAAESRVVADDVLRYDAGVPGGGVEGSGFKRRGRKLRPGKYLGAGGLDSKRV